MNTNGIVERLQSTLGEHGFRSAIVPSSHVMELRQAIEDNLRTGHINEAVYRQYSADFDGMLTQDISWARSIIVVAMPQPVLQVTFRVNGKLKSTVIPPTYEHGIDGEVTDLLDRFLTPHGYQIGRAILPQKLLSAHSGLARYGKNNIAYVDGIGSFHRLIAFYTDLPAVNDTWGDPQMLDECASCTACTRKCPTAAIDADRFQLHADRCLTFHNESSEPFPSWIDESWHECLVGCMKCQQHCPVNRDIRSWMEPFIECSEEESAMLLRGTKQGDLPRELAAKFDTTDLLENPLILARNIKYALVNRE